MAATKKKVVKQAVRKAAAPRKSKDVVFYVVSKRSLLFTWTPVRVFPDEALATNYKNIYESQSAYGTAGYKIDKAELIQEPPRAGEVVSIP